MPSAQALLPNTVPFWGSWVDVNSGGTLFTPLTGVTSPYATPTSHWPLPVRAEPGLFHLQLPLLRPPGLPGPHPRPRGTRLRGSLSPDAELQEGRGCVWSPRKSSSLPSPAWGDERKRMEEEEGKREGGGEEAGAGFGGQKPRDRAPSMSAEVAQAAALAGALGSCFPARATPSEVPTSPTRSARC